MSVGSIDIHAITIYFEFQHQMTILLICKALHKYSFLLGKKIMVRRNQNKKTYMMDAKEIM